MSRFLQQLTSVLLLSGLICFGLHAEESMDQAAAYEKHYPEIKYPTLRKAIDAGEVFLIDANRTETFQKGHLPGARSIQDRKALESQLPVLKNYPIVVYCGGPQCPVWQKAADFAAARGYTSIMHYKGGLKDWKAQGEILSTSSGS